MGRKTGRQRPETVENGGRLCWKPRSTNDCSASEEQEQEEEEKEKRIETLNIIRVNLVI
jgi:hypothetical protein